MCLKKDESVIKYKIIYTVLILLVYLVGRRMPLCMIDISAYVEKAIAAEELLLQTASGDIYQCSIFALGISPFMISSIIVQVITLCRSSESRARISPKKMSRVTLALMVVIAFLQAVMQVQKLQFRIDGFMLHIAKIVSVVEMITGAMLIMWMSSRNKKYGIGGQSALIFLNIIDGIVVTIGVKSMGKLLIPLLLCFVVMVVTMIMENTEKRIPVQRISIHNIYADKNYIAIKFNPIGVMPAMFSTAFFMLPQMLISVLLWFLPENSYLLWWQENLSLSSKVGITVYILILYVLSVGFSRVFINPREITEQYLKSGDSIVDLHAGKDTKRYISRVITRISLLSATVMSICLLVPMLLQMKGYIDGAYAMLPSMVMMMTGIWCNLYREYVAIRNLEDYKSFI